MVAVLGANNPRTSSCVGSARAAVRSTDAQSVQGLDGAQLQNAATLMGDAKQMGLPVAAQMLVVQAAIGESSLRNIDDTDTAGTVSGVAVTIGILQQDDSYGPRTDRLDVAKAGTGFLSRLKDVPGWESLEPTIAIHRVQRNADPQHYAKYRAAALEVVQSLSGAKVSTGGCGGGAAAGTGDDLPWGHGPVDVSNDLGMYTRECVDFALWRVNQAYGSTSAPFRFTNADFRGTGRCSATPRPGWTAGRRRAGRSGWPPVRGRSSTTPRAWAAPVPWGTWPW
ncbi:CHAP domain-containing protein [Sinomonas atrocyanea]